MFFFFGLKRKKQKKKKEGDFFGQLLLLGKMEVTPERTPMPSNHLVNQIHFYLGLVSCVGSLAIIVSYLLFKKLRKYPFNLVVVLSISGLVFSLSFLVAAVLDIISVSIFVLLIFESSLTNILKYKVDVKSGWICFLTACFTQFFGLASVSWNGVISLNFFLEVFNPFFDNSSLYKYYHLFVWSLCLILTTLIAATNQIGPVSDNTCWIEGSKNLYRLTFLIPLCTNMLIALVAMVYVLVRTRKNKFKTKTKRFKTLLRMIMFSLIFIVSWLPPLIHRTAEYFSKDNPPLVLKFIDVIGVSGQAAANAICWILYPPFRMVLKENCKKSRSLQEELLIKGEQEELTGDNLIASLRRNMIACLLEGLKISVTTQEKHEITPKFSNSEYSFKEKFVCKQFTEE